MTDWQPDLYMQFKNERTQPSIDLVAKIDHPSPESIIDVGCGPGNSTEILRQRWPRVRVVGIDRSVAMIEKARRDYPDQEWQVADATSYQSASEFDIVFSNAVIQWIPDHKKLLAHLHSLLCSGGVLAVQIPLFWEMPLGRVIDGVANNDRWQGLTGSLSRLLTIHDYGYYYDILAGQFNSTRMWVSEYLHIMENPESILTMMRSTGLKPYLEKLEDESEKADFEAAVLSGIKSVYPRQADGKVILPFKRLFFTARK